MVCLLCRFILMEAKVCKELGFNKMESYQRRSGSLDKIWMTDVACNGDEVKH